MIHTANLPTSSPAPTHVPGKMCGTGSSVTEHTPPSRILLADDDYETLQTYGIILREAGYSVAMASSARKCAAMIHHELFELVLLDFRFGAVDGITLLRRLRRSGIDVPIVIVTGFGDVDVAVTAMKCGADDFVGKTIDEDELLTIVRRNVRRNDAGKHCISTLLERRRWNARTAIRPQLLTEIVRTLREIELGAASLKHLSAERLRLTTLLARASASRDLAPAEFVACAKGLSRLMAASQAPLRHAVFEALNAIENDFWRVRPATHPRIAQLIDGLALGSQEALARSEADWGARLRLHPTSVGRAIYGQTGRYFREWRRVCRLKRAAYLLSTNDEQVAQIAFAVGFEYTQTSQFSREFRSWFGLTPLEFRQLVRRSREL